MAGDETINEASSEQLEERILLLSKLNLAEYQVDENGNRSLTPDAWEFFKNDTVKTLNLTPHDSVFNESTIQEAWECFRGLQLADASITEEFYEQNTGVDFPREDVSKICAEAYNQLYERELLPEFKNWVKNYSEAGVNQYLEGQAQARNEDFLDADNVQLNSDQVIHDMQTALTAFIEETVENGAVKTGDTVEYPIYQIDRNTRLTGTLEPHEAFALMYFQGRDKPGSVSLPRDLTEEIAQVASDRLFNEGQIDPRDTLNLYISAIAGIYSGQKAR